MRMLRMTGESPFLSLSFFPVTSETRRRGRLLEGRICVCECVHGGVKTDFGAPPTTEIDKT